MLAEGLHLHVTSARLVQTSSQPGSWVPKVSLLRVRAWCYLDCHNHIREIKWDYLSSPMPLLAIKVRQKKNPRFLAKWNPIEMWLRTSTVHGKSPAWRSPRGGFEEEKHKGCELSDCKHFRSSLVDNVLKWRLRRQNMNKSKEWHNLKQIQTEREKGDGP